MHVKYICFVYLLQGQFFAALFALTVTYLDKTKTDECDVTNATSCGLNKCCVYKIIINRLQNSIVERRQMCQSKRMDGELCLMNTDNLICPCHKEYVCKIENNNNFGHCK